jgi:hypothetical protein
MVSPQLWCRYRSTRPIAEKYCFTSAGLFTSRVGFPTTAEMTFRSDATAAGADAATRSNSASACFAWAGLVELKAESPRRTAAQNPVA